MKTENELRQHLEEVKKQIFIEQQKQNKRLVIVGKTILATIMYVLEDTPLDLNRLEQIIE